MENNIVKKIIEKLMKFYGVSKIGEVLELIEVNKGTYDSWRHRGHIPIKPLQKIAKKTGISVAELMDENSKAFHIPPSMKNAIHTSRAEAMLLEMFKMLDTIDQERIYNDIRALYEKKTSFSFMDSEA